MRQRDRRQSPKETGGLDVGVNEDGGREEVVGLPAAGGDGCPAEPVLASEEGPTEESIGSLASAFDRLTGGDWGTLAPAGSPIPPTDDEQVSRALPLAAVGHVDPTTSLVHDLERLREASDQIARTSEWVEQHSRESPIQDGPERVESSRGRARAVSPPRAFTPRGGTRQDNRGVGETPEIEGVRQDAVPMKTTRVKTSIASSSPEGPLPTDAPPPQTTPVGQGSNAPFAQGLDSPLEPRSRTAAELEAELAEARDALRRLRERTEQQTRMYGTVGAQTRKLDQRAAELRARVTKAQEALNERARKFQSVFERERDRLRAYHDKLRQRAKELSEWTNERKRRMEEELSAQRAEIEAEREALARREAKLEERLAETGVADRLEAERLAAEKEAELAAREQAIAQREAEIEARVRELESRRATEESEIRARAEESAERTRGEEARSRQETAALRSELEKENERRVAEWQSRQDSLAAREESVLEKERVVRRTSESARELQQTVAARSAALDARDAELAKISAALEVRERRLQAWQERIEQVERRLDETDTSVQDQAREIERQLEENRSRGADLDSRFEELQQREHALARDRSEAEAFSAALREKEAALERRSAELERLGREQEEQNRRIAEDRRRFEDLNERSDELDRQRCDLASRIAESFRREEALKELEKKQAEETASLERGRKDLDALRTGLASREQELEKVEAESAERVKRAEEAERQLQQKTKELAESQAGLDRLREERERAAAELEKYQEKLASQQVALDEAQLALQMDRHHLEEREQALEVARRSLQKERDELAAERTAASQERIRLDQATAGLDREREDLGVAKSSLKDESARLDRETMALRDRERVLAEGQAGLEAARGETENLRQDLAKRVEDVDAFRRQLLERTAHLKARKEQLAKDAATVDERLRSLNAELAKVAEDRRSLQRGREELAGERAQLAQEREQHGRERSELEEARLTFQAGLRSLDESRRHLAEREAQLGARTVEVECIRTRLEEDRAELQRQREELLATQAEHGGETGRVQALMAQVEAREAAVRTREEGLGAREHAVAARAAELSKVEEELHRRGRELEARSSEIVKEEQALEAARNRHASAVAAQRSAEEESRRQSDAYLAAERSRLEERAREIEAAAARHRQAAAVDELAANAAAMSEIRKQVEAELADRLAEVARKEEAVEANCHSRLMELDGDIAARLADFEREIRDRREKADREIADRRRAQEEELRGARHRLDEQVDDLRRRQQAAAQEQAELRRRRLAFEDERKGLAEIQRRAERDSGEDLETLPAAAEQDEAETTSSVEAVAAADDQLASELPSAAEVEPRPEPAPTTLEVVEELGEDDLEVIPEDEAARHDPRHPPGLLQGVIDSEAAEEKASGAGTTEQGEPAGEEHFVVVPSRSDSWVAGPSTPGAHPRSRRRRAMWGGLLAALAGCGGAAIYLFSQPDEVLVRGRVTLNQSKASAPLTAAEHMARLNDATILQRTSQAAGMEVEPLLRSGRLALSVTPAGDAVELVARVRREQQSQAQDCLDAWGAAYRASLQGSVATHAERSGRLSALQTSAQRIEEQRRTAAGRLEELRASMQSNERLGRVEAARTAKSELKVKLAGAREALEAAKAALAQAEAAAPQTAPVVPTDEQLAEACAADAELVQAMQQRDAQARELHKVLTEAMSKSQIPLTRLLSEISALATDVVGQTVEQTDADIRRELEQIAVDVGDYQRQAEGFSRSWDELAPKVAAWRAGGDAELLREYQRKAETLIRDFHSESGRTFGLAASKADAIGRGGSEMTKRRIIQGRLMKACRVCLDARNDWIMAARGVVPRYNLELKALDEAVRDLTPRIEERQAEHRAKLVEHLEKVRTEERAAELAGLRAAADAAARQYQSLSDEFVRADAQSAVDSELAQEMQKQQAAISEQEQLLTQLDEEANDLQREIQRLQSSAEVSLSDSVAYQAAEAVGTGRFEPARRNKALVLCFIVAGVFLAGFYFVTGLRRRGHGSSEDTLLA